MKQAKITQSAIFVMGFSCPFPGAGWNRISYLARRFSDRGVDCSILSTFFPINIERLLAKKASVIDEKKIRIYNIIPQIPLENPIFIIMNNLFSFIFGLPFIVFKKPDVMIISIAPGNQLMGMSWVAKLLKMKFVVDYRDEVEENWIIENRKPGLFYNVMRTVFSSIYHNSYLVTPTTPSVAKKLKEKGADRVFVVADGVDTTKFKPMNQSLIREEMQIQKDTCVLIFVGYVQECYRVDVIVNALKLLKEKNKENEHRYLLLVVGGGSIKGLLRHAEAMGVGSMVKYLGIIKSPEELVKILNAADFGMIPYNDNPNLKRMYPTKIFEYTACGLSIIATTFADSILAEYIRNYGIGIATPPLISESLAKAIDDLWSKREGLVKMKKNSLAFAHSYEKSQIAEELFSKLFTETKL
jgi:glycosyltransferase involved in cell wall biosynthesis